MAGKQTPLIESYNKIHRHYYPIVQIYQQVATGFALCMDILCDSGYTLSALPRRLCRLDVSPKAASIRYGLRPFAFARPFMMAVLDSYQDVTNIYIIRGSTV